MLKFDVFTSDAYDARCIAEAYNGVIQSYNVGDDEECFIVTFAARHKHSKMVKLLSGYSWEEVISEEI